MVFQNYFARVLTFRPFPPFFLFLTPFNLRLAFERTFSLPSVHILITGQVGYELLFLLRGYFPLLYPSSINHVGFSPVQVGKAVEMRLVSFPWLIEEKTCSRSRAFVVMETHRFRPSERMDHTHSHK